VSDDERLRLRRDLDPVTIGEYDGFKTLEIARIGYRTRMNTLFSCAVVASRLDTLQDLTRLIAEKLKSKESEIQQKLKRDTEKLTATLNTLKCNPPKSTENQPK
jgi:hypothetical protein